MAKLNGGMNPQEMSKIMKEFAKETAKMEMQGEMMADQMDMMNDPNMEADADQVYNQILAEVGMTITDSTKTGAGEIKVGG